jgi:hypothetical protein
MTMSTGAKMARCSPYVLSEKSQWVTSSSCPSKTDEVAIPTAAALHLYANTSQFGTEKILSSLFVSPLPKFGPAHQVPVIIELIKIINPPLVPSSDTDSAGFFLYLTYI